MGPDRSAVFLMIKPSAVEDGHMGSIVTVLERSDFSIVGVASRRLTAEEAGRFYDVHRGKEFFEPLVEFITSGMTVGILMVGPGVEALRELVGATDPAEAAPDTIRALYGRNLRENAVHASDSPERVKYEAGFYFEDCPRTLVSELLGEE